MVAGSQRLRGSFGAAFAMAVVAASAFAQSEAERERTNAAVVMIKSKLPTGEAFGAGVIVSATPQDVYIVTANHLVRHGGAATDVQVQLNPKRGEWVPARILDLQDADLDLAALVIRPAPASPDVLKGAGAAPSSLPRGSEVYPLGFPRGRVWDLPLRADIVASATATRISFESQRVGPGNSGGPLLDPCGHVVGLVVNSDPPLAEAVSIETVLDTYRKWGLPRATLAVDRTATCSRTTPTVVSTTGSTPPAADTGAARTAAIADVRTLHEQRKWAESLPTLNRLVSQGPASAEVYALRSHAYSHLDRIAEATADGEQAVKLAPMLGEAYLRRGEARMGAKRVAEAMADYDKAIQLAPKEFEAWVNRAGGFLGQNEPQKAIDSASQALKIRTDRFEPYAVRGNAYRAMKNFKAAAADFGQAIALRPDESWLYLSRADAYLQSQQFELALTDANHALKVNPDDPDGLVTRGVIYAKLGRTEAARQDVEYALRLRPGMTDASEFLRSLSQGGTLAAPANTTSAPRGPSAPPPSGGDAMTYARLLDQTSEAYRTNRFAEAGTLVSQMIALDPNRPEGWTLRGVGLITSNDWNGAAEAYQNALSRGGTVYFRLAHDHGSGLPPCFGDLAVSAASVSFAGESAGHQLQWPKNTISEAAINQLYGSAFGMLHFKTQNGRRVDTFNFAVVRPTDRQIINRRADAEVLVSLVNTVR